MIDSHAHVHDEKFDDDREEIIGRFFDDGLEAVITVGTNEETSMGAIKLAQKYENIYATIGLHPLHLFECGSCGDDEQFVESFDYDRYLELAKNDSVVAIGEVGLDYHHFSESDDVDVIKQEQKRVLIEFIKICNEVDKPIVIHCWDGYDDLLKILEENPIEMHGVIHSFIGSWKTAQKFIELGFKIGLNGIITYGESYDKLIKNIDLKDVLLETDAPYLPPRPLHRENRCEPKDVKLVAQKIANVKDVKLSKVTKITNNNAVRLFGI